MGREEGKGEKEREGGRKGERDELREENRGIIKKGLIRRVGEYKLFPDHDGKQVKGFKHGNDTYRLFLYEASSGRVTTLLLSSTVFWWYSIQLHAQNLCLDRLGLKSQVNHL